MITALAEEVGAIAVARDARASADRTSERHLLSRLRHHITEHQRALHRSPDQLTAWMNGLMLARILVERVFETRRHEPHLVRDELVRWLGRQQRKFVMSAKADAIERLRAARETEHEKAALIADELSRGLRAAIARYVQAATTGLGRRLIQGLDSVYPARPDVLPADALAGLDLVVHAERPFELLSPRHAGDVEAHLVQELERVSSACVYDARADFDATLEVLEPRFIALLDAAIDTARRATVFAERAQREGPIAVARAHQRVTQWTVLLDARVQWTACE